MKLNYGHTDPVSLCVDLRQHQNTKTSLYQIVGLMANLSE